MTSEAVRYRRRLEFGHDTQDNYIPEHSQREMYGKRRFCLESCFSGAPQADSSEKQCYILVERQKITLTHALHTAHCHIIVWLSDQRL